MAELPLEIKQRGIPRRQRCVFGLERHRAAHHVAELVLIGIVPPLRRPGQDLEYGVKLSPLGLDRLRPQPLGLLAQPALRAQRRGQKYEQQEQRVADEAGEGMHARPGRPGPRTCGPNRPTSKLSTFRPGRVLLAGSA